MPRHYLDKLKKLSAMGPREIFGRLERKMTDRRESSDYRRGAFAWSDDRWRRVLCAGFDSALRSADLATMWADHLRTRREPAFPLGSQELVGSAQLYRELFAERLPSLREKAEQICRGEFSFLGLEFTTPDPIAWQCDPVTGRAWPAVYFDQIQVPFCDGPLDDRVPGDAKNVWELNRHEFLIDCAKAYYLTGEPRYAARVFQVIESWMAANPYLQGINWAGPLEVAVRAISWIWALQFCRDWRDLPAGSLLTAIKGLYLHGVYLYRHLEIYSSPNNHLVGEAAALFLLGTLFPEFDEAAAWRRRGWAIVAAEPERQFFADGASTEQSTSYHYYCLGFFLLAVLARRASGGPIRQSLLTRLEQACQFGMWMTLPDGTTPSIGDADDSRSIRLSPTDTWDFRNLLSIGAAMFRRADMRAVAAEFSEDALWLLGRSGYDEFHEIVPQLPAENCRAFTTGGYAVLRSGWEANDDHLCFDCGAIGLDLHARDVPVTTHGHADLLSFTLAVAGRPLLVDSGLYSFSGAPDWHAYHRDVQAHNTLRVDGRSQAALNIYNAWSRAAQPDPLRWQSCHEFECVQGGHSGFCGARGVGRHQRAIVWKRGAYWVIVDRLEGEGEHEVEAFFHFAPGTAAVTDGVLVETDEGLRAQLQPLARGRLNLEVRCGQQGPAGGWIATSYGQSVPAPVVRVYGRLKLPTTIAFLLTAQPVELPPATIHWHDQSLDDAASDNISLAIAAGSHHDTLALNWQSDWLQFVAERTETGVKRRSAADHLSPVGAMHTS